jgi:hypothetical protein
MRELAVSFGINWNWFLVFEIKDGKAIRHYEGRLHKGDEDCGIYTQAAQYKDYSFNEIVRNGQRLVTELQVNGKTYPLLDAPLPRFTNDPPMKLAIALG